MPTLTKKGEKNFDAAVRKPFAKRFGLLRGVENIDARRDNDYAEEWSNAAGTAGVEAIRVDADNAVQVAKEKVKTDYRIETFHIEPNGKIADQVFWISDGVYTVEAIYEIHKTAGSDSGAVTGTIKKAADGVAIASGTALTSAINLKATADTLQTATLSTVEVAGGTSVLQLAANDRIGIDYTGTLTALAGVTVILVLSPAHRTDSVTYSVVANGDLDDDAFFIANKRMTVTAIKMSLATAGTDASAVNVQVVKDTGTDAPGAGTNLLTNNSNAGFNCKGTINTVQDGTLTATAAALILAPGNRLSVDFAGTLTALAGVVVTVYFEPVHDRKDVTFASPVDATSLADQTFFIADRDYEIITVREVHSTAGTDGSAVNAQLTLDTGTDAPGAGTDLLSNNSNAGFNMKGTANTVQKGTFIDADVNFIKAGERLAIDFAGTLTSLAGVVVTVTLKPV